MSSFLAVGVARAQTPEIGQGLLNPASPATPGQQGTQGLDPSGLNATSQTQDSTQTVPPLRISGAVSLDETYATNALGGYTSGASGPDEYTQGMFQASLRYNTRRTQTAADYSFQGNYFAKYHNLNEYLNYLDLGSTTQVIPDHLQLNVSAFASPMLLNRTGAVSAGGEPISSTTSTNTYGYVVDPQYTVRVRDILTSVTTFSQDGVYFVSPFFNATGTSPTNVSNASTIGVTQRFVSGDYFGRLNWSLDGDYQRLGEQSFVQIQKDGVLNLAYALNHNFQLLGTGGYNYFNANVPLDRSLSGPEALGGFTFTPSPSMRLTAEAGVRNRSATYIGSLHWNLSQVTSLDGSLTDGIYTPQGAILGALSGFGPSLLNPGAAITPFSPSNVISPITSPQLGTVSPLFSQGLAIDNFIYHDRMANVALTHTLDRTTVGLGFYYDQRTQLEAVPGASPDSTLYGVTLSASRQLRNDLSAYLSLSYSTANEFGGNDQFLFANLGLNFALSDTLSLFAAERYLYRQSNYQTISTIGHTTDNEAMIGITRRF